MQVGSGDTDSSSCSEIVGTATGHEDTPSSTEDHWGGGVWIFQWNKLASHVQRLESILLRKQQMLFKNTNSPPTQDGFSNFLKLGPELRDRRDSSSQGSMLGTVPRQGIHPPQGSTRAVRRTRSRSPDHRGQMFCPDEGGERGSYWDTSAMCLWRSAIQRSSSSSRSTSFTRASPMPLVSYLERGCPHKIHPVPSGL